MAKNVQKPSGNTAGMAQVHNTPFRSAETQEERDEQDRQMQRAMKTQRTSNEDFLRRSHSKGK